MYIYMFMCFYADVNKDQKTEATTCTDQNWTITVWKNIVYSKTPSFSWDIQMMHNLE